jgi:Putative transposase/Transposase zinc-binding domain
VLEVADIVRAAGPEACHRLAVLPSQKRALQAILQCRTAALGGQVYGCEHCGALHFSYHSCGNRHCPKCHGQQTERWLQKQRTRLLPCPYYLVTFTLPAPLRALARCQQKVVYGLLLHAAARSLQKLCADPQWMGGQPSLTGVLHTWTRAMLYHPHAHFLVSAGGLSEDARHWLPARHPAFLVPVRALSTIFRAKIRDGLRSAGLLEQVPAKAWRQPWVVHAQHAGAGEKVLEYLGRYVFRIAMTQSRLDSLHQDRVTFHYRDNQSQQIQHVSLRAEDFVQRFLQHVLPQGLPKVRHYGLAAAACQPRHAAALALLSAATSSGSPFSTLNAQSPTPEANSPTGTDQPSLCPQCHVGQLIWLGCIGRGGFWPRRKVPP